jgi:putative membrane protein
MPPHVRPLLIDLDGPVPSPADALPVPEALPQDAAMQAAGRVAARRGCGPGRFAAWALSLFAGFVLSVVVWEFVARLLSRSTLLGSVALVLAALAVLALGLLAGREALAFARLARIDRLRSRALAAQRGALAEARAVAGAVQGLYARRDDLAWARARLAERQGEVLDADALMNLTETELLGPLDAAGRREIEGAARQVALVTALVPVALADVAAALYANLRMMRRLAELYGGRSGAIGSWGLMRRVFSHLVATGALALTDDLIGSVAGGGLLSKVSRRFGEGVVNGALTARVGIAAMELCRPMPFTALPKPKVTNVVRRALTGLFDRSSNGGQG